LNRYEGMYIFQETMDEETLEAAIKRAGEEITRLGGTVQSATRLGKRAFAHPMDKQRAGHYVVLTFDLDGAQVGPLQARYRLVGEVFRVQIVRAVEPQAAEAAENEPADEVS
jgi:small subunit ribosomal protein S6